MHGGEVKERHELVAILLQARDRIWIFGLVGFYEQIKCFVSVIFVSGVWSPRFFSLLV